MIRRRKKKVEDFIEPDLPITPMLDMSFQLLAFFVMTFNPTPAEGHLDMALPKLDGGPSETAPPPSSLEEADELLVSVKSAADGSIGEITVAGVKDTKDATKLEVTADDKGDLSAALMRNLKDRLKTKAPCKVKLEMMGGLKYAFVVKLIDEINRAGYRNVAPEILDPEKPKK